MQSGGRHGRDRDGACAGVVGADDEVEDGARGAGTGSVRAPGTAAARVRAESALSRARGARSWSPTVATDERARSTTEKPTAASVVGGPLPERRVAGGVQHADAHVLRRRR